MIVEAQDYRFEGPFWRQRPLTQIVLASYGDYKDCSFLHYDISVHFTHGMTLYFPGHGKRPRKLP